MTTVTLSPTVLATDRPTPRTPATSVTAALVTITSVLIVDASAPLVVQRLLGVVTWGVLVVLLARESSVVRAQTLVVVVFATAVEYTFSPLLGVYLYRFDNVPMYVPPGHGLVYLAAWSVGRLAFVKMHERVCTALVMLAGGVWAVYGILFAGRIDVLGAFWFLCLMGFLLWGPSRGLYIGAFVVVSYLELVGTTLGDWQWQPADPTGLVSIGNPPSGAAGGYGWFDLVALLVAPALLARIQSLRRPVPQDRPEGPRGEPAAGGR